MSVKWGLSVLDWRSHAIDEHTEHPLTVLKAECGHLMMMVTALREKPTGAPCETCAALQFDRAMAKASGRIYPPRSGDDEPHDGEPDPPPWAVYVGDCGHRRVMSNPAHIGPCPDCDTPDRRP